MYCDTRHIREAIEKRNMVDISFTAQQGRIGTQRFLNKSPFLIGFFSGFRLQYQFCYTQTIFLQFWKLQSVFYPKLSIICIFQHLVLTKQLVYFGDVIFPKRKIVPPRFNRLMTSLESTIVLNAELQSMNNILTQIFLLSRCDRAMCSVMEIAQSVDLLGR